MKVDVTKEEICDAWEKIVNYCAENPNDDFYPSDSIMIIKKVIEAVIIEEKETLDG